MSCFYAVLSEEPGQVYGERIRVMKYDEDGTYTSHSIEGLEVSGLLRKQRDGKIYISPYGGTHLTVMDDAGISFPANYQSVQGMGISQINELGLTAGTISAHPYRIKFPNQSSGIAHRRLGYKHYELTDHLGNVRAVVSDRLALQIPFNYALHQPEVLSYTNYYPFGMLMPGRVFSSGSYRWGFGGHERDDEVKGNGNWYSFGGYGYNPRVVQRPSRDPKWKDYPNQSPYAVFNGNPIYWKDIDGREPQRAAAGTIEQAMAFFKLQNATTIAQIAELYATTNESEPPQGFVRYVYTDNNGWIDLRHYFGAIQYGETAMDALELSQCADGLPSCYSYEDLPSNNMGGNALVYDMEMKYSFSKKGMIPKEVLKTGDDLLNAIAEDFIEAEATNPESAPNWEQIPANRTRPAGRVPQNFSEQPLDLTNFSAADDSIEMQQQENESQGNDNN